MSMLFQSVKRIPRREKASMQATPLSNSFMPLHGHPVRTSLSLRFRPSLAAMPSPRCRAPLQKNPKFQIPNSKGRDSVASHGLAARAIRSDGFTAGRLGSLRYPCRSLYSTASRRASQLASMMLALTPTVPQMERPSVVSIKTLVRASVLCLLSRMRTL